MSATADVKTKAAPAAPKLAAVVIEGEIGAGKSTLVPLIAEALRKMGFKVAVALEPVDQWRAVGILERFCRDPARYAYEFQTFTYVTRLLSVQKALRAEPGADYIILERTVLTDRFIFMELQRATVGPQAMQMYETWCGVFDQLMPKNLLADAKYFYLKPELKQCMARVQKRARAEEVAADAASAAAASAAAAADSKYVPAKGGVTLEYQGLLRKAHESFFEGKHADMFPLSAERPFTLKNVTVLDGSDADGDFSAPGSHRDLVVHKVISRIGR